MAGLWDTWKDPKGQALWLDPGATSEQLMALLVPSEQVLEPYAVSSLVNVPANDLPACIEAAVVP